MKYEGKTFVAQNVTVNVVKAVTIAPLADKPKGRTRAISTASTTPVAAMICAGRIDLSMTYLFSSVYPPPIEHDLVSKCNVQPVLGEQLMIGRRMVGEHARDLLIFHALA